MASLEQPDLPETTAIPGLVPTEVNGQCHLDDARPNEPVLDDADTMTNGGHRVAHWLDHWHSHFRSNGQKPHQQPGNAEGLSSPTKVTADLSNGTAHTTGDVMAEPSPLPSPQPLQPEVILSNGFHEVIIPPEPEPPSQLDLIRERVGTSWAQITSAFRAIQQPFPVQTGDGTELTPPPDKALAKDVERDIKRLGCNIIEDLGKVFQKTALNQPLDDRKYYMESLIHAAANPPNDIVGKGITDMFLTTLWQDLEHPPQNLLSPDFDFRQPDGSKNNIMYPHIGAAGMPYARTVRPQTMRQGQLPDPGVLFDALMARKDSQGTEHPNRISSILFYLASIIIHDVFKTNRQDYRKSDTSSYLDLAPLYGSSWVEQKRMRTMKDGKIKPDCFSEPRLLTFPPGVGALLIMFNRYHNSVVEQLALINEDGRFTEDPRQKEVQRYGEKINKRDDDLFQTARLITCGLYINIILIDYVRVILNLNRTNDNWQLNPRVSMGVDGIPVATGNQVSCEFNLVYRWHSAVSQKDDEWTQQLFREMFPDTAPADIATPQGMPGFLRKLGEMEAKSQSTEPMDRPWPATKDELLERTKDGPYKGSFNDDKLAEILIAGIQDCANAMGPRQVPTVMKAIEMLGIAQARSWRVATLNEFRKHFDLTPHQTFEDITHDEEVADALRHLYNTPDDVELYPGLVVEDAKMPKLPGSGLCPSFTVSRAVLSDAVALVRGDRYYTTSYTPASMTNWGYSEVASDLNVDNGCVFYKLFLTALPNNFNSSSVYVHYPMTVPGGPDGMEDILKRLGKAHKYNFDEPKPTAQPQLIFSYDAAKKILEDQQGFHVTGAPALDFMLGKAGLKWCLAGDGPLNAKSRQMLQSAVYLGGNSRNILPSLESSGSHEEKWLRHVRDYYEQTTTELLRQKMYTIAGTNYVDIVRDVGNLAHVHFCADMFSLPLKTVDFPRGVFTEAQLFLIMCATFTAVFLDVDPAKSFPLRWQAYELTQQLGAFLQLQVAAIHKGGSLSENLIEAIRAPNPYLKEWGVHMMTKLLEKTGGDVADVVWGQMMPTMGGVVAAQAQSFAQVLDFYLSSEAGIAHWPQVQALAKRDTPDADAELVKCFLEGSRLGGETGVFRSATQDVTITDDTSKSAPGLGNRKVMLKKGDQVLVNLKAAGRDPAVFPDPETIKLDRPLDKYMQLSHGVHQCLGLPMTVVAQTTMLKVIARIQGLKPALSSIGKTTTPSSIKKVPREFWKGDSKVVPTDWHFHAYMMADWDVMWPFPMNLKVQFDGAVPEHSNAAANSPTSPHHEKKQNASGKAKEPAKPIEEH